MVTTGQEQPNPRTKVPGMGRKRHLLWLAALLAIVVPLGACGEYPAPATIPIPATLTTSQLDELVAAFVAPQGEGEFQQVMASLPAPAATTTTEVANRHDPRRLDSLVTLSFANAELTVYRLAGSGRELPAAVRISQPGYRFEGIEVGMPPGMAVERLGESSTVELDELGFHLSRPHAAPVGIELIADAGEIVAFSLTAYLD